MFRHKALERLKSPEDLDHLLTVIPMRSWFIVLTLTGLSVVAIVWSIFGRIPITVDGFGVLINPGNVKGVQSRGTGEVESLNTRVGQFVEKGEVLARINQPELAEQIRHAKDKLADVKLDFQRVMESERKRLEMQFASFAEQRTYIDGEIKKGRELEDRLVQQQERFTKQQRENLTQTKELSEAMRTALGKRVATIQTLKKEGLTSDDLVLNVQSQYMDSESRIADFIVRMEEVELGVIEREQSRLQRQNRLADLELQLLKLDIEKAGMIEKVVRQQEAHKNEVDDLQRQLDRLMVSQAFQGVVESPHRGRILELTISEGQVIQAGSRIGTIEVDDPDATLKNLAFLNVRGGKLIQPGDRIRVTPATVERERYGSIVGRVEKVSPFPITQEGAMATVGSPEIARALMEQGGAIEVEAELLRDPDSFSGYQWTSKGPPLKFSAGTTTTVRVTIEERAPITYVLPILRTWVFGQKDDKKPTF